MAPFIGNKLIKINFQQCHSFTVYNNTVVSEIGEDLSCPLHEEADTKIIYHICNVEAQANIIIKCSDTDVAVIMLANMHHLKDDSSHVWILTGTGNKERYVDLTKIYEHLGSSLCRSLSGFHAITGCDHNPAFFRKGKQRPFKILQSKPEYQQAFLQFGEPELFNDENTEQNVFNTIQKFICEVYNVTRVIDVDAARLQLFINTYTVSDVNEEFNCKSVRNFDASNLPPCKSELLQQFHRANYIASIWNNAYMKNPSTFSPENNGWVMENDQYNFNWFHGDQLPSFVSESLQNEPDESTGETEEVDDENDYNFDDFLEEDIMDSSPFEGDEIDD